MADTTRDQEEQDLRIDLMQTQQELYRRQFRWETWKAVAAVMASGAVVFGAAIGISNWLHPQPPQQVQVQQPQFPPGTVITIPPANPAPGGTGAKD